MYASVEMLLKFFAENFPSESKAAEVGEKPGAAQSSQFCNREYSHWRPRHFTHTWIADRIHFALIETSNNHLKFFFVR
jgi:hypothetical protein